ncbi:MAG: DsrE family protein [Halieaceae bacterium]|jgi:tRNA 2-thiouridine synthesizing protein D|nr:DsrE family protein [Halieaceae bacterium]
MRFTLLVLSAPDFGCANRHALRFARAVIDGGHELACVFFQDRGVLTALKDCESAQAEEDLRSAWQGIARDGDADLAVCSASAARFGVADGRRADNILDGFALSGLGDLVMARGDSDRFLTFAD